MKIYQVYIKSHCEAPDYEKEFASEQLKDKRCLIKYTDDGETVYKCSGELKKIKQGYQCQRCKIIYFKI